MGIAPETAFLIVGLVVLGVLAASFIYIAAQQPGGFACAFTRSMFYDTIYALFGPRVIDVECPPPEPPIGIEEPASAPVG